MIRPQWPPKSLGLYAASVRVQQHFGLSNVGFVIVVALGW